MQTFLRTSLGGFGVVAGGLPFPFGTHAAHSRPHTNVTRLSDGVTGPVKIEISNIDIDTFTGTSYWYNLNEFVNPSC